MRIKISIVKSNKKNRVCDRILCDYVHVKRLKKKTILLDGWMLDGWYPLAEDEPQMNPSEWKRQYGVELSKTNYKKK